MKVYEARILGLIIGLLFGGAFALYFDLIMFILAMIGTIQIFMKKQQILTGTFGGLLIGLAAGYFLRGLIVNRL